MRRIWIVGSGSLAQAACHSLSVIVEEPTSVTVVARSGSTANALAYVANTRARLLGVPLECNTCVMPLDSPEELAEAADELAPDIVLNTASHQSPWEHRSSPSAWTALTRSAGLGVTLPLQAAIARRVGLALSWAAPDAVFLNASFPDAVNPLLHGLDLPVFAGIGNVGLIAATLQGKLGLVDQGALQVLAHHWHLGTVADGKEALAWHEGVRLSGVTEMLHEQRATPRHYLNPATGHTAALLLRELSRGSGFSTNLPGPEGLPGGYPVWIEDATISLRLPEGLERAEAVAWNQQFALADGVIVEEEERRVRFAPRVEEKLLPYLADLAAGFEIDAADIACDDLLALRDVLCRQSSPELSDPGGVI